MRALLLLVLLAGCEKQTVSSDPTSATTASATPVASVAPVASAALPSTKPCGLRPTDWCPSPDGDPCGEHKDVTSCRADSRCKGMRYRGESLVACKDDGTGFTSNCPNVGCISR